ncbi:MAG: hypothetical protein ACK410_02650 [Acinetobacter sp.]
MEVFYSIQELVELQLIIQNPNFPNNRQGFEYRAKKEKWEFVEEKSTGRNGTKRKFIVPIELRISIQNYLKPVEQTVSTNSNSVIEAELPDVNNLMNWQREIAENRLFVVRYIQQKIKQGMKKTPAIEHFILEADALLLPIEIQEALSKANAKAGEDRTISRRSIFDWIKAVEDSEKHQINVMSVLAPKARRSDVPDWAMDLLKLYAQPQKPTLPAV